MRGRLGYLARRDGEHCFYCGSSEELTMDHICPVSKGGPLKGWKCSNLVLACRDCNEEKGDMDFEEYIRGKNNGWNNRL